MRFRFLKGEHGHALRFIELCQQMIHERLKKEDDRETLNTLAVAMQRQPWPVRLIPQDDFSLR